MIVDYVYSRLLWRKLGRTRGGSKKYPWCWLDIGNRKAWLACGWFFRIMPWLGNITRSRTTCWHHLLLQLFFLFFQDTCFTDRVWWFYGASCESCIFSHLRGRGSSHRRVPPTKFVRRRSSPSMLINGISSSAGHPIISFVERGKNLLCTEGD